MNFKQLSDEYKEQRLRGRYITLDDIAPLLEELEGKALVSQIAKSVRNQDIYSIEIGNGTTRILIWSQMHGNESTTTKAIFDFSNFLVSDHPKAVLFRQRFTIRIIPLLNPDGAADYTRENANGVDLNRDFCDFSQPESKALFEQFQSFRPDYCYNMHDQRTIFGAGNSGNPATVSFLAPSYNSQREFNDVRLKAVDVINAMNSTLQELIPGQIGRFDDSFNLQCAGDRFQAENVPTILFEAGHFPGDYDRETSRQFIFIALISSLERHFENDIAGKGIADYLNISQNKINFYDFVYKNVKINYDSNEIITNFAAQYKEELVEGKLLFNAYIAEVGDLDGFFGHIEYDADGAVFYKNGAFPEAGMKADFYLGDVAFLNGKMAALKM